MSHQVHVPATKRPSAPCIKKFDCFLKGRCQLGFVGPALFTDTCLEIDTETTSGVIWCNTASDWCQIA